MFCVATLPPRYFIAQLVTLMYLPLFVGLAWRCSFTNLITDKMYHGMSFRSGGGFCWHANKSSPMAIAIAMLTINQCADGNLTSALECPRGLWLLFGPWGSRTQPANPSRESPLSFISIYALYKQ